MLIGIALCRGNSGNSTPKIAVYTLDMGTAITESMTKALRSTAMICGYIIFFSMLNSLLQQSGLFTLMTGFLCERTPLSIGQSHSAVLGLLELGSGIASMQGLSPSPGNLALCAFVLGWGGICVQFQTAAVLNKSGLKSSGAIIAKALHGVISAAIAFALGTVM